MAEELGKQKLNFEEKSEEPTLENMEEQFRYKVQKKKFEGRSSANGGIGLRAPWKRSWREHAFVIVVLSSVWVFNRG